MRIDLTAWTTRCGATPSAPGWIALLLAAALLLGPAFGSRKPARGDHSPQTAGWAERMPVPTWSGWAR